MKKILVMMIAATVAGIATADIAVELKNDAGVVTTDGSTFVNQAYVQLVWNASAPAMAPGEVGISLFAAGDYVLNSLTTSVGYGGTWSDQVLGVLTYADTAVGSVNILTGNLSVRIFDDANKGFGAKYLQFGLDTDGSLTEYNSLTPSTIYETAGALDGNIGASSYTVVPEPATIGLFGIGAIGAWILRNNKKKAQEEADA